MNGAGKKVWGYYPTTDTWIPLQVDANGKVVVDMSGISLGDLGDTWLPAPGDQYFLYWDDAASKWDCRILVDADIPDGIARDAEVDTKIAAHHDTIIKDADEDTKVDVEESADEDKIRMDVKGVEALLIHDDGIIDYPKQSGCRARLTNNQPLLHNTWTKVALYTVIVDKQSEFDVDNYRFTAKRAGWYLTSGAASWEANAVGNRWVAFYKNGALVMASQSYTNANGLGYFNLLTPLHLINLDAEDYMELWVKQNSGAELYITTGATSATILKVA